MSFGVGYATLPGVASGAPPIAQVSSPTDITSTASGLVSQALQPYFQQSQEGLEAQLAANGLLGSGAGSQQLQQLSALNNATFAQAMLPVMQQQQQLQSGAASQNANAADSYLSLLTNLGANLGEFTAGQNLQSQEYNQGLLTQLALANQGIIADPYLQQLNQIGGLYGSNQGSSGSILGSGANNAFSGYMNGVNAFQNFLTGAANDVGAMYGMGAMGGGGGGGGASNPNAWANLGEPASTYAPGGFNYDPTYGGTPP